MPGRPSSARQTLQEFYEQLARKWREAEDLLLSLEVPESVSVPIKTVASDFPGSSRSRHELGFIRHYGRWGICYGVGDEDDPQNRYWTSIHRCSIEQRVEATRVFPELRDRVLQAAERYAETVAEALAVLDLSLSSSETDPADNGNSVESNCATEDRETVHGIAEETILLHDLNLIAPDGPPDLLPDEEFPDADAQGDICLDSLADSPGDDDLDDTALSDPERPVPAQDLAAAADFTAVEDADVPHDDRGTADQYTGAPADGGAMIVPPFPIQSWESDGGEIARDAA